jgi:hypothetical protein
LLGGYTRAGKQEVPLTIQYGGSSFSVGGAAVATEAYAVSARRTERWDVHVVEVLGGAAEDSYEQEAAAVEEDKEMGREDERGVAKRPGLNELDMPEWAELALNKIEWRELLKRIAL